MYISGIAIKMLKNDIWIEKQAQNGMITPFINELIRCEMQSHSSWEHLQKRSVISYGLSSYGYDIRLSPQEFKVFRHIPGTIVDPKAFNPNNLVEAELMVDRHGEFFVLPGNSYGLGVALERLEIPKNVTVLCIGKSTYARVGLICNQTPAEAGWKGHLTLEFSNSSDTDCRLYANEGIAQLLFFEGEPCEVSYADRAGKYQNQPEKVVLAKV